jgi:hypothetical protein
MSFDWKKTQFFSRHSNVYTFTKNPLFRKNQYSHIYLPWDQKFEDNLMFQLKEQINSKNMTYIPFMDINQKPMEMDQNDLVNLNAQALSNFGETHLVMSNLKSIHIFRIVEVCEKWEVNSNNVISQFNQEDYSFWIKVDDLFVLDVNHIGNDDELLSHLKGFINEDQLQNVFTSVVEKTKSAKPVKVKWVSKERSLTYEYFIRSCELKDNIYQESWEYFSRVAQHELINCELLRQKCVFHRGDEKWCHLRESFQAYQSALIYELNDIYILPLVNAITNFESLDGAWKVAQEGLISKRVMLLIKDIISQDKTHIDNLEDFLFFTESAKSFYYSLKNQFTNKFHKEEFLLVENFLEIQEALIDSFNCRSIGDKLRLVISLDNWIEGQNNQINTSNQVQLKDTNLKLSHLLSIMVSANSADNIFFRLMEEKMERGASMKSFDDEVKSLTQTVFRKAA